MQISCFWDFTFDCLWHRHRQFVVNHTVRNIKRYLNFKGFCGLRRRHLQLSFVRSLCCYLGTDHLEHGGTDGYVSTKYHPTSQVYLRWRQSSRVFAGLSRRSCPFRLHGAHQQGASSRYTEITARWRSPIVMATPAVSLSVKCGMSLGL